MDELPEYIQRMKVELTELQEKVSKLYQFTNKRDSLFDRLSYQEQDLLHRQLRAMREYEDILFNRYKNETAKHVANKG